jgi:predicted adenylyl cyclase CyaB
MERSEYPMKTNIEIKARARDFQRQKDLASQIAGSPETLIHQDDTFFDVPHGRLKLRIFSTTHGELIYYERDNIESPKQSNYCISETCSPNTLKETLSLALPVRGNVRKKRHLFLVGQTRIHFDEVETLGNFIELEVVMKDGQSTNECLQIADGLMKKLDIKKADLINCAYIDLLLHGESA